MHQAVLPSPPHEAGHDLGLTKAPALPQTCEIHLVACIALRAAGTQSWHGRESLTVVGREKGFCRLGWAPEDKRCGEEALLSRGQSSRKRHPSTEMEGELSRGRTELANPTHFGDREEICLWG